MQRMHQDGQGRQRLSTQIFPASQRLSRLHRDWGFRVCAAIHFFSKASEALLMQ